MLTVLYQKYSGFVVQLTPIDQEWKHNIVEW